MHVCLSDVAGGYSASMLDAVRRAQDVSKFLAIQDPGYDTLTFEEVFRLATLGGSQGRTHATSPFIRVHLVVWSSTHPCFHKPVL